MKDYIFVSEEELSDADEMLSHHADIEIHPPTKVIKGHRGKLLEKEEQPWVKLSVRFRDEWMALLQGSKLAVFLSIALHIDENGQSFPGIELISKETGYSERQVIRAIQQLESQGLLNVNRVYLGNKISRNFYNVMAFVSYGNASPEYQSDKMSLAKEHQSDISDINVMSQMSPQVEPVNLSRTINNTKIQKKLQEDISSPAKKNGDQMNVDEYKEKIAQSAAIGMMNANSEYAHYPERIIPVVERMARLWYFRPPARSKKGKQYAFWIQSCGEILEACAEFGVTLLDDLHKDWSAYLDANGGAAPYPVSSPKSLLSAVQGKAALMRSGNNTPYWRVDNGRNKKPVRQSRLGV